MNEPKDTKAEEDAPSAAAAGTQDKKPVDAVEDFPDPDEDDLDDLDDMLDDFAATKLDQKKPEEGRPPAPSASEATSGGGASGSNEPPTGDKSLDDILADEDFGKQLQAGMADLLGELGNNPEMQAEFDNVFKSITEAAEKAGTEEGDNASSTSTPPPNPATAAAAAGAAGAAAAGGAGDASSSSFQDTIRRTMERMQASGDQATAAATESSSDDLLAEMMKQMGGEGGAGGVGGLGEGSEEEFSKMLMGMMEQLTNKEILYEPMKELDEKFPGWLEENKEKTSAEDLKRYEDQRVLVREIVGKFEESSYADSNAADREYIVERMQKMQDAGSPPSDLVGDMASAQEAFNAPDLESCNPQ